MVPVDVSGKFLLFHPFQNRFGLHAGDLLVRIDQGRRHHHPSYTLGAGQGEIQFRFPFDSQCLGIMGLNGINNLLIHLFLFQDGLGPQTMVRRVLPRLLKIQVVKQSGNAPRIRIETQPLR